MTNISITLHCNRSCSYCFARELSEKTPSHMTFNRFEEILEFITESGTRQVRLLGGEPTIHPQFSKFLDAIEQRDLDLLVFSNGCMPKKALDRLNRFPREKLSVLLNIHTPDMQPASEWKRIRKVFQTLGSCVILGHNIHSPAVYPYFLIPLINEFELAQIIRLGLAHPCIGEKNRFLHPRYYQVVGRQIGEFVRLAMEKNIKIDFDCGFVPCMFSEDDLKMMAEAGELPGKRCNPLPDFLPDGRFIPCYPLAHVTSVEKSKTKENNSIQVLLAENISAYRKIGIYSYCSLCAMRAEELCTGGCLAAAMKRTRQPPAATGSQSLPR